MNLYETYIRERLDEVNEARGDAEGHLISQFDNGDPPITAVAAVAHAQAVARWWHAAVTGIDQECLDPVDALHRTREAARHLLTDQPIARLACPFAQAFALARVEAARFFYQETAHLDEITTRRAS